MSEAPEGMRVVVEPAATVFEYVVVTDLPEELPLDRVVLCERQLAGVGKITYWGVIVSAAMGEYYYAKVRILRINPDVLVPPAPFCKVWFADTENVNWALRVNQMGRKFVIGEMNDERPAYADLDALSSGAYVNIAGIPKMSTKTSYALFLLYSLLTVQPQARSIVFNTSGDDLLYLDKPNRNLSEKDRQWYAKLGLPCGPFPEVACFGTSTGLFTLREFAQLEMLRYLIEDPEESGPLQLAVDHLAERLHEAAEEFDGPGLKLAGEAVRNLAELFGFLGKQIGEKNAWFENVSTATRAALLRRLKAGIHEISPLISEDGHFDYGAQLSVVDIHSLSQRGKAFAIAAVLGTISRRRQEQGGHHPTTLILLDEMHKYAPKEGDSSLKKMLLDLADRARKLGIVVIGTQPSANLVDDQMIAGAALRAVGRLEASECRLPAYPWLAGPPRRRSTLLRLGTMIVSQPTVAIPLAVRFPFPAWATKKSQVAD